MAVMIATLGVLAVVYGGSQADVEVSDTNTPHKAPLIGDLLTLVASVSYGFYQVLYKRHAALPQDPEPIIIHELYDRVSLSSDDSSSFDLSVPKLSEVGEAVYPPPFGFHPNFLTSMVGLSTFILLMLFVPLLDYVQLEPFRAPPDGRTVLGIAGMAGSGVVLNAGLMVRSIVSCARPSSNLIFLC
jgi:drug/metabolite transporter (DMT)-like permease